MIDSRSQPLFDKLPDAILFDLDNTLYPYEPTHSAAMSAVEQKAIRMFAIQQNEFNEAFKTARSEIKKRLNDHAASHSRLLYFQRMLELLGLKSQLLLALDFEQTYWRTFLTHAKLFPDAKEVLDEIRLLGIPMAIVTDLTTQIQFRKLIYFGLDHAFDYVVTSEEAGHEKPHPAPFELAVTKLKASGKNIWMVGDHPERDIMGAKKSIGARGLQKVHEGVARGSGETMADATFADFSDLRSLIGKLGRK